MSVLNLSKENVSLAHTELEKVFHLSNSGIKVEMFSKAIDSVWHDMLKNKEEYKDFCNKTIGRYIKHIKAPDFGEITFTSEYEKRYGKLDSIWFMDENGKIDITLQSKYKNSDTIVASWDCSPEPDPDA